MTDISPDQIIHGHVDEESAFVVDGYPYGRDRTLKRYWIETVAKRGDRVCSQTLNPKTGRWNKAKKSTYAPVQALYLEAQDDGRDFVKNTGLGLWRTEDDARAFIALVGMENLNKMQRLQLAHIIGSNRVMAHVKFTVHEGEYTAEDEAKGLETQQLVNKAIAAKTIEAWKEIKDA